MSTATLPARRESQNGNGQQSRGPVLAGDSVYLKGLLESQSQKIADALPRHLKADKLIRAVLVSVSRSDLLKKCTAPSILQCLMIGSQLGLDVSGTLGSAYMVPFFNSKLGAYEAVFMPGYRGLVDLARRSGEIDDISANVVYVDDVFEFEMGGTPKCRHIPNVTAERSDDKIVGAYMVAFLKGSTRPHIEFMPRQDLLKIRDSSKAALKDEWVNGKKTGRKVPAGPWNDWFSEMCRKSVVKRGVKYLPLSVELAEAIALDDAASRTEVYSASTGPTQASQSRLAGLTEKLLGDGKVLEIDAEAQANAAAQDAHHGETIDADTGEVQQDGQQEPDGAGNDDSQQDAGQQQAGKTTGPDVSSWDATCEAIEQAMSVSSVPESDLKARINLWKVAKGANGREEKKTTVADRLALVQAIATNRLGADGKITDAAPATN